MSIPCCVAAEEPTYSVLLLGPDAAGKSTLIARMTNDRNIESVTILPTVGLVSHPVSIHGYDVLFYDTAGVADLTEKWGLHFGKCQGFIYVIDSTDRRKCDNTLKELKKTLQHPDVRDKPVLIVATKMDRDGALDEDVIFNVYDLDTLLGENGNAKFSYSELPRGRLTYASNEWKGVDGGNVNHDNNNEHLKATVGNINQNQRMTTSTGTGNSLEGKETSSVGDSNSTEESRGSRSIFLHRMTEDELKELQSMTFKRGTLWLLEQIDINKRTIDGRIAQYMTTKGVEVRRSIKSWTRIQKVWEKNQKKLRKSVNEAKHDQEGDEDEAEENATTTRRNTVRASDSAEKLKNALESNRNQWTGASGTYENIHGRHFPHARKQSSLVSGRLASDETVVSKRGISFRGSLE